MSVHLAATWNPRGESRRFQRLQAFLESLYTGITVIFPPLADPQAVQEIIALGFMAAPVDGPVDLSATKLWAVRSPDWSWGRYLALKKSLDCFPEQLSGGAATHIQYADMDRLIRWAETNPDSLRQAVNAIQRSDCLIFGRTDAAYRTHPESLRRTEAISNRVVAHLLGCHMDVSAGSKAFSRRAAEFIIANSEPGRAIGTDAEWPVLLQRGGFRIDYLELDALDWETADRYQEQAASVEAQRRAAEAIDRDPRSWARRVEIAMEIVESGLDAYSRILSRIEEKESEDGAGEPDAKR